VSEQTLWWLPWAVVLSALAGWLALRAWRRADAAGALRWSGWALVPPALLLTGTARLVGRIAGEVASWAATVVINPFTWAGIVVGAIAVAMIAGAAAMRRRRGLAAGAPGASTAAASSPTGRPAPVDDDMAEIDEILRRRGI